MDATAADLATLQGHWQQVYLEADGVTNPPDAHSAPGGQLIIRGHNFSVHGANGEVLLHGAFELDATTNPKSITWIDAIGEDTGKRLPASYELTPDRFIFIAADEGAPRPLIFRTAPGQTLRAFRRPA